MSWTISHRHEGRPRHDVAATRTRKAKPGIGGLIRHDFRDIDKTNGVEVVHSNDMIDPARTTQNSSWMWVDGERRPITQSSDVLDELDRRLDRVRMTRRDKNTGKTKQVTLRKDACVVEEIIITLDPQWTGPASSWLDRTAPPDRVSECSRAFDVVLDHYADLYGVRNMLAASLHLDETHPNLHLLVTPITDDNRVSRTTFIPDGRGPSCGLARNDQALRRRMIAAGFDIDPEPRRERQHHLALLEYKRLKDRETQVSDRETGVSDRETGVSDRETQVSDREMRVSDHEQRNKKRAAALIKRETNADQRDHDLDARETRVSDHEQRNERHTAALIKRENSADQRDHDLDARETRVQHLEAERARLETDRARLAAERDDLERWRQERLQTVQRALALADKITTMSAIDRHDLTRTATLLDKPVPPVPRSAVDQWMPPAAPPPQAGRERDR